MAVSRMRVLDRIEELAPQAIELTQALVRIDSRNPTLPGVDRDSVLGGESMVNDVLEEFYRGAGLDTSRVAIDPQRSNLIGIRQGTGGGRSLALNGHVDTVSPVDPARWITRNPWDPQVIDGRLYGIGSTDMKGSGATMWMVAQALEDCGVRLQGDLQLHSVVGEEMMEHELGTSAVIRAVDRPDAAIVTEPSSLPLPLSINSASPSLLAFTVAITGKATHSGNRPLVLHPTEGGDPIGVNAVEVVIPLVHALLELELEWGMTMKHPVFPDGWFTIGPNILRADAGSPFPASMADRAYIEYVVWHSPTIASEVVQAEIEAHINRAALRHPWLRKHPPVITWNVSWQGYEAQWEAPIVQALLGAQGEVSGVRQPTPTHAAPSNFGAACDATFYQQEGIPAIVFGPGDVRIAHGIDEFVRVDQLTTAAKILALTALDWCGTNVK